MKKINYYVIGGQYAYCCYGGTHTLADVKRLAEEKEEYWDNWQGWHRPEIYRAKDVEVIESCGRITTPDGWEIHVPKPGAKPVV